MMDFEIWVSECNVVLGLMRCSTGDKHWPAECQTFTDWNIVKLGEQFQAGFFIGKRGFATRSWMHTLPYDKVEII